MSNMMSYCFLCVAVLQMLNPLVFGYTQIRLELLEFTNPEDHDMRGNCCDPLCVGACDLQFTLCMDKPGGSREQLHRNNCPHFLDETKEYSNDNTIQFGDEIGDDDGDFVNPISFQISDAWTGMLLKLYAEDDDDGNSDDPVDWIHDEITLPANTRSNTAVWHERTVLGDRLRDKTIFKYRVKIYCHRFYYEEDCMKFCRPFNNDIQGHYRCDENGDKVCYPGWEDDPADHPNLSFCNHPADDCEHANCGANGRCVDGLLQYTCQCDDGHYGDHCEHQVNPCQNSPCVNNGQCTDISDHLNATMMVNTTNGETSLFGEQLNTTSDWNMTTNFRCTCEPGYSGDFCEIHGCGDHTCRNGAICIGGVGCNCSAAYIGHHCETPVCSIMDCGPQSYACLDGVCQCKRGYEGVQCERDQCEYVRCPERQVCDAGLCIVNENAGVVAEASTKNEGEGNQTVLVAVFVSLFCVIVIVCLILFLVLRRRKRNKSNSQDDSNNNITHASVNGGQLSGGQAHSNYTYDTTTGAMATVNPAGISPSGRGAVGGIENGAMGGFGEKKEPLDNFYSCEENNYSTLDEMKMKQDKHSMPVHRNDYDTLPPALPVPNTPPVDSMQSNLHISSEPQHYQVPKITKKRETNA